ncbi:B-cell receptor CD22 [Buteo buteo]|uniref:B-cell receptor CD22 n=1 Tax=Buteo buteo TaxID=30397 RepID=UPI003EBC3526
MRVFVCLLFFIPGMARRSLSVATWGPPVFGVEGMARRSPSVATWVPRVPPVFGVEGSLSICSEPVMGPTELVAGLGSCLYISCHYDLCQAGQDAQLDKLVWIRNPFYENTKKEFMGVKVSEPPRTPEANKGDCSLILRRIRAGDAGLYGLRLVANPSRRNSKDLRWMHRVTVNVTETFTLTWEGPITKTPGVQVEAWTPPDTVVSFPVIGTLLTFEPFWYHDETFLNCTLRGSDRKIIAWASRELQVNYPPRDVQVELTPSLPVHEGQEVTLSCRSSAKPPSHAYTWSMGGHILPHQTAQVVLRAVQATESGPYSCQATNAVGTIESPPTVLRVYYAPRDVRVEVTPPSPIHEGWEVTLSCRDSSNPPSHTYTWTMGGHILPYRTARVLLEATKAEDGGSYSCQATNDLGTAKSFPTTLEVYCEWGKMAAEDPPRTATLENLTSLPAMLGSRVTLRCAFGPARPAPTYVQWLRDERWEADTPGPALTFNADPARAGAYRCAGQNPAGRALSPPLSVIVWYPPKTARVLQSPAGPVVAGGGPVRLRCQVGAAEPPQVTIGWFKNGQELPAPTPDLLLPGPQPADAAVYACQARNDVGVARSPPVALDVRFGPQGVELVPDPSRRVQESTNVTLRCRADARPPPSAFEWFRDDRPLGRTPKGLWVLRAVETRLSGRYRCRVTNDIATVDSDDVIVTVYHSTATILRRTFVGLGAGLSILLALGTLGCFLRRRWQRQMAADEEPVVEPSGTFFLCNKKPQAPGSPRPPRGADDTDTISYSSLLSPPTSGAVPR